MEEWQKRSQQADAVSMTILKACGEWSPGRPGVSGTMQCPRCGNVLRYVRSGFVNYLQVVCDTKDCLAWSE